MGRVIFTSGKYAKTPYNLKNSKLSIRSIEELIYCILKNPELCEDFLYDKELASFIDFQLGLKERANLLRNLIDRDAPLRDIITVVFCSADYLGKAEIEEFISDFSKRENSEEWVRIKNKADSYLNHENYKNAIISYRNLIKDAENLNISSENLGDIYHNMGVAILFTEGFNKASDSFREAYERNNREESLKQYLLALKFADKNDEYNIAVDLYDISQDIIKWLNAAFFHTELEVETIAELKELENGRKLLAEGRNEEFYQVVNRQVDLMKKQYRKYNE